MPNAERKEPPAKENPRQRGQDAVRGFLSLESSKSCIALDLRTPPFTINRQAVASDILRRPTLHPQELFPSRANRHVRLRGAQRALTGYGLLT